MQERMGGRKGPSCVPFVSCAHYFLAPTMQSNNSFTQLSDFFCLLTQVLTWKDHFLILT